MIPRFVQRHFLLAVVVIVVISRLPTLAFPLMCIDEADFAVQTAVWMEGGIPYVDFVEKKTLVIHSWFRWIFELFGVYNMTAMHVMDIVLILVTIGALYAFARYVSGEGVARWAALLYAFFQSFYDLNDFLSTATENLMNLFAIAGAYVFFRSMREDRPGMSLLAGALIGISIMAKQVGAALLPACVISMVFFWYEQKVHRWHRYVEEFFLLIAGVIFPIGLLIAYLTDVGGFDGFIRWVWIENFRYASAQVSASAVILRGLLQGGKFISVTWALWILAIWTVVHFARRHRWRVEIAFLVTWIAFTIPAVSLGGRFFVHYFLQFLPPLVVLAAIGVVGRWEFVLRSRRISARSRIALKFTAALLVLIIPYVFFLIFHFNEVGQLKVKTAPVRAIAAKVSSITEPDDRIFVWGHDSDIYFFARRMPASRFLYCSYLTGIKEGYEFVTPTREQEPDLNAWIMLKQDFERQPPLVIVDLSPTNWRGYGRFPISEQLFLANYVHDHFERRATIHGADIYVRK